MLNSIGSVVFQGRIHYAGTYHGCVTYVTAHNFIHYNEGLFSFQGSTTGRLNFS